MFITSLIITDMFTHVWSKKEKAVLSLLVGVWLSSIFGFWVWWFQPQHIGFLLGFVATSFAIAWPMLLPAYCFYFLLRMKKPHPESSVPAGLRVAMVVTKAPCEPLTVVIRTLKGMLSQTYPHDTWVADENPTQQALAWYRRHGVRLSCRKDDPSYHNNVWPRRKKCKEGNLTYFYDKYGYGDYDVVVQMDADHVPYQGYLEHMLRPFSDAKVGYVAAPSICDSNKHKSWSARARLQAEAMFHGPIQSGSNDGWVPICIGSHYAVRTAALKRIGGLGPELAEDYSTTLSMNACGWKGVWVYDAEAHGEGPSSFSDIIVQDYQWARSVCTIFLLLYLGERKRLNWKQRLQFTFTQLWYPLSAAAWLISTFLPILVLLTGKVPVRVDFVQFLAHLSIPLIASLTVFYITLKRGHLRPRQVKFISWEGFLFELARWPWVLIACADAFISSMAKKDHVFRVTPKGQTSSVELPIVTLIPYIAIASICFLATAFSKNTSDLKGYYWFAQITAWFYLGLSISAILLHIKEAAYKSKLQLALHHMPHFLFPLWLAVLLVFVEIFGVNLMKHQTKQTEAISPLASQKEAFELKNESAISISVAKEPASPSSSKIEYYIKDRVGYIQDIFNKKSYSRSNPL